MIIRNEKFNISQIQDEDILICAIGYEERSCFFMSELRKNNLHLKTLVMTFKDFGLTEQTQAFLEEISDDKSIELCGFEYNEANMAVEFIVDFINRHKTENNKINIDYSSMPRSWFSMLALRLERIQGNRVRFWYSEGEYPADYQQYPGAGIDKFTLFSGKPTLRVGKRFHVLGLSYDVVRTQAIISILDPDIYITCDAISAHNLEIKNNVYEINKNLISQAGMSTSLIMDDFVFMVNKLSEIVKDFLYIGDVILVPDGPKPLIFAMSLIPALLNKPGIVCLHVTRNKQFFNPVNITAKGSILGFSIGE